MYLRDCLLIYDCWTCVDFLPVTDKPFLLFFIIFENVAFRCSVRIISNSTRPRCRSSGWDNSLSLLLSLHGARTQVCSHHSMLAAERDSYTISTICVHFSAPPAAGRWCWRHYCPCIKSPALNANLSQPWRQSLLGWRFWDIRWTSPNAETVDLARQTSSEHCIERYLYSVCARFSRCAALKTVVCCANSRDRHSWRLRPKYRLV